MTVIPFVDLVAALDKKHKNSPEVFLMREVNNDFSSWKICVGLPGMPKIVIRGDSHDEVIEKTCEMYGVDPYVSDPATSQVLSTTTTHSVMKNKLGEPILLDQIWQDCDKRRQDRFAKVIGYGQWHVNMLPCDEHGNILNHRTISINPLRMQPGSTGWKRV